MTRIQTIISAICTHSICAHKLFKQVESEPANSTIPFTGAVQHLAQETKRRLIAQLHNLIGAIESADVAEWSEIAEALTATETNEMLRLRLAKVQKDLQAKADDAQYAANMEEICFVNKRREAYLDAIQQIENILNPVQG